MLGSKSKRHKNLIFIFALILSSCSTTPKVETFEVGKSYAEVFKITKDYIAKCAPGSKVRANLYTDVPEATIIMDYTPGAKLFVSSVTAYSSYEKSRDTLNIHFKGVGQKTVVTVKVGNGKALVQGALNDSPCPQ